MTTSRAKEAWREDNFFAYNAKDGRCSAHGRDRCDEPAEYMLSGKVLYPACQRFIDEHPEIPIVPKPS